MILSRWLKKIVLVWQSQQSYLLCWCRTFSWSSKNRIILCTEIQMICLNLELILIIEMIPLDFSTALLFSRRDIKQFYLLSLCHFFCDIVKYFSVFPTLRLSYSIIWYDFNSTNACRQLLLFLYINISDVNVKAEINIEWGS